MTYKDTFILISDDCPTAEGTTPPSGRKKKTSAKIEHELLSAAPYKLDHDDLNYTVHTARKVQDGEPPQPREEFLSKGRPCMRASALVKRYGWGAHYDDHGRIAIYPAGGKDYVRLSKKSATRNVIKGMRNKRAK